MNATMAYAADNRIGRLSMWSLNRDRPCGSQSDTHTYEPTSSASDITRGGDPVDDPSSSAYPIWRDAKVYDAGSKVVWHHDVYESKWWSQGDMPDAPVVNIRDAPWRLLGRTDTSAMAIWLM